MKKFGLMKTLTVGALISAVSMSANAGFMTATADGGFAVAVTGTGVDAGYVGTVDSDAEWIGAGTSIDLNGDNPGGSATVYEGVQWGGDGAYSSLVLTDFAPDIDLLDTNYLLSSLTHNNFRISASYDWLTYASILGHISFSSENSGGIAAGFGSSTVVDDFTADAVSLFNIEFTETFNRTNPDDCSNVDEDGIAGGDNHTFITGCDDYFDYTIDNPDPLPDSMPFGVPFYIDGSHYSLTIFASLDSDGSTLLPAGRFWTEESKSTTIYTFARLTEVPEPSVIALFGLAAIGLGLSRKRKNKLVTA